VFNFVKLDRTGIHGNCSILYTDSFNVNRQLLPVSIRLCTAVTPPSYNDALNPLFTDKTQKLSLFTSSIFLSIRLNIKIIAYTLNVSDKLH